MPTAAARPQPQPSVAPPAVQPRRWHRWACTVWCGTRREVVVEVVAWDRERARELIAHKFTVSVDDVLVRYVATVCQ